MLYRFILELPITTLSDVVSSSKPRKLPVVLSSEEIHRIFEYLNGDTLIASKLIYGCGLRLTECLTIRIKDFDFEKGTVTVRSGKGDKDRVSIFPDTLKEIMRNRLTYLRVQYGQDRAADVPGVALPHALERKYPNAGKEWGWFWVFPSFQCSL